MKSVSAAIGIALVVLLFGSGIAPASLSAQRAPATRPAQKMDEEYGKLIQQDLQDPRITTELVDHMPASDTVPSPLKFFGRIPGTPGELTYAKDIYRYYEALAKASPRARYWKVGTTEEGRDIVLLAIADEATIKSIDKYRDMLGELTDPRKTSEQRAQQLLHTAKPIYYAISGMHSPETGGPEMLIELAYRLIVEESPFIQNIRNNVITLITPVIEVDGREAEVDTYYFNKKRAPGDARLPLMYWGKYVQHDNNRDGMGQFLKLTQTVTKETLEWHPTVMHDLHEAQTYLYASTGTGPYNDALDPIVVDEWWMLAENDVMEMTKRGVPGVWTYGFYDGWVPNYMFYIAHSHNAIGRFYEVQSYGPDNYEVRPGPTVTSKEWFRPNPPLPVIKWGPRNNTNIQESALLFALNHVAKNKEMYLENYWLKNKRAVDKGRNGPTYAWVIPSGQRRKADAADAVNELLAQGLEISRAQTAFKAGSVDVKAGDYIVRGDQPFRTLAEMYFSVQNYAPQNPSPYDDTGWTFQYMRDVTIEPVTDKSVLAQQMTAVNAPARAPGGIEGTGSVLVVDDTADNNLVTFRFKNKDVKMSAAEEDFDLAGHRFRAGSLVITNADRGKLEPSLQELGLSAWAVASAPTVRVHDLDIPRIGYIHSWTRTQDEGWWRAALDTYGVPYTYFADQKLKDGNLRAKYDVIIFPHVGGSAQSQVNGMPVTGSAPLPYKKTAEFPNLAYVDSSDDIRGGMGVEGLAELAKFVREGGTLITEGSTSTIFPDYGITTGVTVDPAPQLFARGTILRARFTDLRSPIAYGYAAEDLPVYFSQSPVLRAGGGGFGGFGGRGGAPGTNPNGGAGQNVTPNAVPLRIQPLEGEAAPAQAPPQGGRGGRGGRGGPATGAAGAAAAEGAAQRQLAQQFGIAIDETRPRVVLEFSPSADNLLLSGTLAGGQAMTGTAAALDHPLGKGHVVMFAIRPFWRWQTQGTYTLGFNAIMNWNDLDAGRPAAAGRGTTSQQQER
ncbi:MAG TPA: M14 family zinc carboxypeptidase [Vicinamibacterales bacterium]|nr:M14 family zinc carboxypeptidase [Vicinamibacterales bacterium]